MSNVDGDPLEAAGTGNGNGEELALPPDLLAAIPEDKREEFSRKFGEYFEVRREESYSGPLQPSREAERWDDLVPGTAARNFELYEQMQFKRIEMQDRILAITEESARHEMEMDRQRHVDDVELTKTELKNTANKVSQGQWFAFIAFIFVSVGGFYMVHLGNDALGIAILVFEAVGVAGVFLNQIRREGNRVANPNAYNETIASDSNS